MNAIVGDNGIITNAQKANVLQSCAALSEYLNEKYVETELDDLISYNSDGTNKSPVEKMFDSFSNWFYESGSNNYVIQDYTYTDTDGNVKTGYLKIRLIRKKNLPEEIRNQLNGGNAVGESGAEDSSDAYDQLKDVFGVTGDLQVFYCENGIATSVGADYTSYSEQDKFDGTKVLYSSSSSIANAIAESNGTENKDLSFQDLRSIKELTISDTSGVTSLESLYNMPNLTKLTLKNYKGTLKGIEKVYNLTYLYFNNSDGTQNVDYIGMKSLTKLSELYFYMPTNVEVEKMFIEMSSTDYNYLNTLGLYGHMQHYENQDIRSNSSDHSTFTNVKSDGSQYLDLLTDTTKSKIIVLYLENNAIAQTDLSKFTSVSNLYLNDNKFTSVPTLKNGTYYKLDIGRNQLSTFSLASTTKATRLYIDENVLTTLAGILNHETTWCNATSMSNLDFSGLTASEKNAMQSISLTIDSKYALAFPTNIVIIPTSTTSEQFKQIKNSAVIKQMSLSGCTEISDVVLQEVLATLNLQKLNLDGTKITSLSCLQNSSLNALSIRNTAITNLTPILNRNIGLFRLNNGTAIINFYNNADETYKTNTKKFFKAIANSSGGASSLSVFGSNGNSGLCTDTGADLANLVKAFEITSLRANYENSKITGNIDLSTTSLQSVTIDYSTSKLILPSTTTNISLERQSGIVECASKNFSLNFSNSGAVTFNLTTPNTSEVTVNTLKLVGQELGSTWKNVKIDTCQLNAYDYGDSQYGYIAGNLKSMSLNCITNDNFTSNVNTLKISNVKFSTLSSLDKFTSSTKLYAWSNNLTSLGDFLEKNQVIQELYLTKNNLSSLDGLENANNLEILDLSNNSLSNYYTSSNGDFIKTSELLSRLPKLKKVYLNGNDGLTDFSALTDNGFVNIGNNVFTKN